MKIVVHPPLTDAEFARLLAVAGDATLINAADDAAAALAIIDADGLIGVPTPELLAAATRLRWVQTPVASLERMMFPALIEHPLTLTNMAGIYSDQIADHVLGFILMFARSLHTYHRRQWAREWQPGAPVIHLPDSTLGVLGLGGIGAEVARRGQAVGMRVLAVDAKPRPKPAFVDELWPSDRLEDLLRAADFLVICVPYAPETIKLIRRAQIQLMKPSAYLINIARGVVVDMADLTAALQAGEIAGAGLDVFEVEPLPADHPLWGMENVLITPHAAWTSAHTPARRVGVFVENLRRFVNGEPLHNIVDKQRWY